MNKSKQASKQETKIKASVKKAAPKAPKVPSLKTLLKGVGAGEGPRGLKVKKNEAGAYVFSYGPKSAPVAIVASADELMVHLLGLVGLKLS